MSKFTIGKEIFLAIEKENQQAEQDYKNDYPQSTKLVNNYPILSNHLDENLLVWIEDKPYMMTITEYNYWNEYFKLITTEEYRCHFLSLVDIHN